MKYTFNLGKPALNLHSLYPTSNLEIVQACVLALVSAFARYRSAYSPGKSKGEYFHLLLFERSVSSNRNTRAMSVHFTLQRRHLLPLGQTG